MKPSAVLRPPFTLGALGALGAGIALVVAACGGGSGTKAAASPTAPQSGSATAFVTCLKSHGYTPSAAFIQRLTNPPTTDANGDGGGGFFGGGRAGGTGAGGTGTAGNTTRTTLDPAAAQARQQALQACQSQAPAGFRNFGNPAALGARLTQLRAYASCLSDHGYPKLLQALPPTPAAGQTTTSVAGGLRQAFSAINRSDPAFIAANQTCQALAPAGPGRGGASTTTTTPGA